MRRERAGHPLGALVVPAVAFVFFTLADVPAASPPRADSGLVVLSANLAMREDVDRIAAELAAIGGDEADVMLLQEVSGGQAGADVAARIASRFGLTSVYGRAFVQDDGRTSGLATLSRLPIVGTRVLPLKRFDLNLRSRERIALAVALSTPDGPLPTYNVHLDTRLNPADRLEQLAGIVDDPGVGGTRALVGGDFNTNRHLWLFHVIPVPFLGRQGPAVESFMAARGLASAFARGATHDFFGMRLDWVFLKGLRASAASIHPLDVSDHHALMVSVR